MTEEFNMSLREGMKKFNEKEFNLSDKRDVSIKSLKFGEPIYLETDVKEFIKRLKEGQIKLMKLYDNHKITWSEFVTRMMELPIKLAGDKLSK